MTADAAPDAPLEGELQPPEPPVPAHWTERPREDVVADIIHAFEDGKTLRSICRDPWMPSKSELYRWLDDDVNLLGRFTRARARWRLSMVDDVISIADEATVATAELAKLRIHARLQILARADAAAARAKGGGRTSDDGCSFDGGQTMQTTSYRIAVIGVVPKGSLESPQAVEFRDDGVEDEDEGGDDE